MLISGSNIPAPRTNQFSDRSTTLCWLDAPVGQLYSALNISSWKTNEQLWTLVRAGLQTKFLKKTFFYSAVAMLSFNVLTISAFLLYVSCGLASAMEVNIFLSHIFDVKSIFLTENLFKHIVKLVCIESNVNVWIGSLYRQIVHWPMKLQRLFHHVHEQTKSGKKRPKGKTVKTSLTPVIPTFITV